MKRRILGSWAVIAVLTLIPAEVLCGGYGYYGWGRGWPSIGVPGALSDILPEFKDLEIDLRHDHFTIGYLHDGASAQEDRFGWRVNFGVDIVLTHLEGTSGADSLGFGLDALSSDIYDAIGYGFEVKGAYGIGLLRTDRVRVWAGPSLRLNADYVDLESAALQEGSFAVEVDPKGVIFSVGGGPEAGVRYAVSPELSLEVSVGFHYNFFGFYQDADLTVNSQSLGSDESFFSGEEPFLFVQLAVGFDFSRARNAP